MRSYSASTTFSRNIKYTSLLAALVATINFTTATMIQPRDDRPASAKSFVSSVWFKLDPGELQNTNLSPSLYTAG
jgi:hypothetical protein